jgi:PTH1 family peptidyl-tRNA hydrolase
LTLFSRKGVFGGLLFMFLIVGLGNPGTKYEHTRHNVGFDIVEVLSQKLNLPVNRMRCQAMVGEGTYEGQRIALCRPQTFMNLSGQSVQALMHWYKVTPENLLVIFDDVDLPPGKLRVRPSGGPGTHNGMRSIVGEIGSEAFPRIRVGIGDKPEGWELADWVLSHYATKEERQVAFDAYMLAADAALCFVKEGVEATMRNFNGK